MFGKVLFTRLVKEIGSAIYFVAMVHCYRMSEIVGVIGNDSNHDDDKWLVDMSVLPVSTVWLLAAQRSTGTSPTRVRK